MQHEAPRAPWPASPSRIDADSGEVRIDLLAVLAHTESYVVVIDRRGLVRFMNRLPPGVSREGIVGSQVARWFREGDRPRFEKAFHEAFDTGTPRSVDVIGTTSPRAYLLTLRPVASREGRPRAVVMTATDVSDARRLERELRRANRMLRLLGKLRTVVLEAEDEDRLAESLCELALIEGKYTGVWGGVVEHDAAASIRHSASGGDLVEAVRAGTIRASAEDGEPSPIVDALRRRAPVILEDDAALRFVSRFFGGAARTRTRKCGIIPVCDGPHALAIAIVTSVHPGAFGAEEARVLGEAADEVAQAIRWMRARRERRLLIEQLVQAQKMEAVGRIAAGVAHDFNNQLTSILGFADMLTVQLEDEALRDEASHIVQASERSAYFVAQLLAFARKGPFVQANVDVRALLTDLVGILKRSFDKRIAVEMIWNAKLKYVLGDARQLENALLNLALNARDAMPSGGTLRIVASDCEWPERAAAADPSATGLLCLDVIDEGVGIDPETQKRIFEPFFTTKPPGEGTGLGLSAVYGTVQRHRGSVEVESRPGEGSRFRLSFPATAAAPEPTGPSPDEARKGPPAESRRILVIDDEPLVGALVVSGLREHGYEVDACVTAEAGIEQFQKDPAAYDLVLVDMVMPRFGGAQVFHALRIVRPDVPVLLMSGYSVDSESEALLRLGAAGFLQKPFTVRELSRRIEAAFTSASPRVAP